MNLHEVEATPAPETPSVPTCACGSRTFIRREIYLSYQRHTMTFPPDGGWPGEDFETRDEDFQDADPWKCNNCDLQTDEELQEMIQDY